jgi:hypothetical protein
MRSLPSGCTKVPWGFLEDSHGLVANTTVADRNARYELGEFAISLLGKLGVSEERLVALISEPDPIEALKRTQ